ncbi:MAG: hypothetical protein KBC96_11010 [Armatimonadetes bacterium]|nr:hypothetical protein [Armatimonadota bacterium]
MSRKHISYFKVLEALDLPGCPICGLVSENLQKRMEALFYEQVNDPGTRRRLVDSQGFCVAHSRVLLELGSPLGVAIIYRDIIDSVSDDLKAGIRLRRPAKHSQCPVCSWEENDEHQYLSILAEHFADEEIHSRVSGCRDFCVPHLRKLLGLLPPDQQSDLRQMILSHLSALKDELTEIVRKSDYQCAEPWGPEGNSWIRTVRKISGCEPDTR